jgi:hypothetical protein
MLNGKAWESVLPAHYGYIKRQAVGADGDHLDVYLGPHLKSPHVFIIDQVNPENKAFDEHKIGIGFGTQEQFVAAYKRAFSDGKGQYRIGSVTALSMDQFKAWLKEGNTRAPFVKPAEETRITRAAFIYLPSKDPEFAQCSTCAAFNRQTRFCSPIGVEVEKTWSCGLYVPGEWDKSVPGKRVSARDAGLVKTQVRCENCEYGGTHCGLYEKLNKTFPNFFALETKIEPKACCNAFTPKAAKL